MRWLFGGLVALAAMAACHPAGPDRAHVEALFSLDAGRRPAPASSVAVAALGGALFAHRLGAASCRECHSPTSYGQDGLVHQRNTPTLVDAARQSVFGWDGLAPSLAGMVQRELATHHGLVHDASLQAVLQSHPDLQRLFEPAFPGQAPTLDLAAAAISAHLSTWRSRGRWDRYVDGDDEALTAAERVGVATFIEVGCAICHGGRNLGGGSVHKLGLIEPYESADRGREQVTGKATDRHVWKAPSLRLAAHTGPYLHDGSVATLADVVRLMGRHELGKHLAASQVAAIVTMLRAVGDVDVDALPRTASLAMEHARDH